MSEHIRDLILMEFAGMITPEEQKELDALVSEDPKVKALRYEIHNKLSDPKLDISMERLNQWGIAYLPMQRRRARNRRVAILVSMAILIFFVLLVIIRG